MVGKKELTVFVGQVSFGHLSCGQIVSFGHLSCGQTSPLVLEEEGK